jgi:hypothetical protein
MKLLMKEQGRQKRAKEKGERGRKRGRPWVFKPALI